MAFLARSLRTVRVRFCSTKAVKIQDFQKTGKTRATEISEAYDADTKKWKYFCLFGVIPVCFLGAYNAYFLMEQEHHGPPFEDDIPGMRRRIKENNVLHGAPFEDDIPGMRRIKPLPWGDGNHSLFHHPAFNALPEGYEQIGDKEFYRFPWQYKDIRPPAPK